MDAIDQILQYVKEKGHAPASQIIKDLALPLRTYPSSQTQSHPVKKIMNWIEGKINN